MVCVCVCVCVCVQALVALLEEHKVVCVCVSMYVRGAVPGALQCRRETSGECVYWQKRANDECSPWLQISPQMFYRIAPQMIFRAQGCVCVCVCACACACVCVCIQALVTLLEEHKVVGRWEGRMGILGIFFGVFF
jgi:hypothetical protein